MRDPTSPDLPHFTEAYEMAYGKKPSGTTYEAFKAFVVAGFEAQKPIFLPKGTPKDIVDTYVQALDKVVKTPGFKEKAATSSATTRRRSAGGARGDEGRAEHRSEGQGLVRDRLTRRFNVKFDEK